MSKEFEDNSFNSDIPSSRVEVDKILGKLRDEGKIPEEVKTAEDLDKLIRGLEKFALFK